MFGTDHSRVKNLPAAIFGHLTMEAEDDDYSTGDDSLDDESVRSITSNNEEGAQRRARKTRVQKSQNLTHTAKAVIPTTLRSVVMMENHVSKQLKGLDIDRNLTLRVIKGALAMQKKYLQDVGKKGKAKGPPIKRPKIRETVCRSFGISSKNYTKIIQSYMHDREVYVSGKDGCGRTGNRNAKPARIPRTEELRIRLRNWVRILSEWPRIGLLQMKRLQL